MFITNLSTVSIAGRRNIEGDGEGEKGKKKGGGGGITYSWVQKLNGYVNREQRGGKGAGVGGCRYVHTERKGGKWRERAGR